ncbi:hypothetical protein [Pseudonocardia sp. NPDC049154]|uniref:hypothetical protein n=1 Tax=Pseudonocardia sp. NPDC049154 TaxID=3155501 RepID=UPI0033F6157D
MRLHFHVAAEVAARLRADAALPWAGALLLQTQPTRSDLAGHLRTLAVAADAVSAAVSAVREPVAAGPRRTAGWTA